MANLSLTFLHRGVQLGDLHGQPVDAVLQRVGAQVEGVGFVEQLSKNVLSMFTWEEGDTKEDRDLQSLSGAK